MLSFFLPNRAEVIALRVAINTCIKKYFNRLRISFKLSSSLLKRRKGKLRKHFNLQISAQSTTDLSYKLRKTIRSQLCFYFTCAREQYCGKSTLESQNVLQNSCIKHTTVSSGLFELEVDIKYREFVPNYRGVRFTPYILVSSQRVLTSIKPIFSRI